MRMAEGNGERNMGMGRERETGQVEIVKLETVPLG